MGLLVGAIDWANSTGQFEVKPHWDVVIEAFGPARLMFGSDWPVVRLASTYTRWFQTLTDFTAHLDSAYLHKLFYANADSPYRAYTMWYTYYGGSDAGLTGVEASPCREDS